MFTFADLPLRTNSGRSQVVKRRYAAVLISRRPLDTVDDQHIHRRSFRFQLKSKLFLNCSKD
jgi:hypothetical protein